MNKNTSKAWSLSAIAALVMVYQGVGHADWTVGEYQYGSATVPSVTATVAAGDQRYHPKDEPPDNVGDMQTAFRIYKWTPKTGEPTIPPSSMKVVHGVNLTHSLSASVTPTYVGRGFLKALAELTLGIFDPDISMNVPVVSEVYQATSVNDERTRQVVTFPDPAPSGLYWSKVFETEKVYDANNNVSYRVTGTFYFALANKASVVAETLRGGPGNFIQSGSGTATSSGSAKTSAYILSAP